MENMQDLKTKITETYVQMWFTIQSTYIHGVHTLITIKLWKRKTRIFRLKL